MQYVYNDAKKKENHLCQEDGIRLFLENNSDLWLKQPKFRFAGNIIDLHGVGVSNPTLVFPFTSANIQDTQNRTQFTSSHNGKSASFLS